MSELLFIKNLPNRAFAEQAKDILTRKNINCILQSPDPGIFGSSSVSASQGVNIYVESDNASRAFELLNALYNGI